jgi:hypothetical protein
MLLITMTAWAFTCDGLAQSADWQRVIWRDPQVRYLLADMTLGGNERISGMAVKLSSD